jgi:ssDNA thymidine ADP-ribosyltransferase, DarT
MPKRFIFRMTYIENLETYFQDKRIYSKNHPTDQRAYQTSYSEIVERRGGADFETPCGGVVNDFVPFYFSPATSMAFAIHRDKVSLTSPNGHALDTARMEDIAFMVCDPQKITEAGLDFWFTNIACNSGITPSYEKDISLMEQHIAWELFDEDPKMGAITEIDYCGVCKYFQDHERNEAGHNRSKQRMAEFLVKDYFPMDLLECVVLKNSVRQADVENWIASSGCDIPVLIKVGCYF